LSVDEAFGAGATIPPDPAAPADGPSPTDVILPGAHRRRACVVRMSGRILAVDVVETREVMTLDTIGVVPGAPAPLLGVANLRGRVVAVADARSILSLPPRAARSGAPAIVLAAGDLEAAVPIDGVVGLEWFDTALPLPEHEESVAPLATFAIGLVPRPDEAAILLDAARLLQALRAPWAPAAPEAQP
jgi:chemotaxis signal transduction protein